MMLMGLVLMLQKEIEAVHGKSQQVLQLKEQVLHLKDSYEEMKSMLKKHHHHYQVCSVLWVV